MFLFILNVVSFSLFNRNTYLQKYYPYCQARYRNIPQKAGFKLLKLIVIHRHGDRTPLKTYGNLKDECVGCKSSIDNIDNLYSSNQCKVITCKDGLLTKKGYNQMLKLGRFIRNNYFKGQEIDLDDIYLRATNVKRTQSSLNGLITGFFNNYENLNDIIPLKMSVNSVENDEIYSNDEKENFIDTKDRTKLFGENFVYKVPNVKDDTLIGTKTCQRLTHILTLTSKKGFEDVPKQNDLQNITDNYLYSLCKNMELDCERVPCEENQSNQLVDGSFKTWTYQSILLNTHEEVLKFLFGKFANDLLNSLRNDKKISIFSAHDNSLSYVLAGLKTQIIERPPLASAIFLEVWSFNGVKYVRIIFNDYVCITSLDKSTNISYEKIMIYLESIVVDDIYLNSSCDSL